MKKPREDGYMHNFKLFLSFSKIAEKLPEFRKSLIKNFTKFYLIAKHIVTLDFNYTIYPINISIHFFT